MESKTYTSPSKESTLPRSIPLRRLAVRQLIAIIRLAGFMKDVDGWNARGIFQEGHLDVVAATDVHRSLGVVEILVARSSEFGCAVASVEIGDVEFADGDAALVSAAGGDAAAFLEAEAAGESLEEEEMLGLLD